MPLKIRSLSASIGRAQPHAAEASVVLAALNDKPYGGACAPSLTAAARAGSPKAWAGTEGWHP